MHGQRSFILFNPPLIIHLFLVLLLMPVNWSIEAAKWKLSVQFVQPVSFFTSFRAVLSGVSFSVIMPNRIGEYLGRVLYINEGNRLKVIPLTLLASCSQSMVTFFFGLMGLLLLRNDITNVIGWGAWIDIIIYGGVIALVILTVFYFRLRWVGQWFSNLKVFRKYAYILDELGKINATLLIQLLSLSIVRYLVFALQYYLLYRFFGVQLSWMQVFSTTSVMFLLLAMLPTIALVELGLRGEISLKLTGMFSMNFLGIGFTTVAIWLINLFIPAAIGSLLILGVKLFRRRNEGG